MQKIKEGALFAIGFTIVAITVGYAYAYVLSKVFEEDYDSFSDFQSFDNIKILETRLETRDNRIVVLGKYKNEGESKMSGLTIKADFFGSDGTFLDQCDEYLSDSVAAGQEAYFKLECSSCADISLGDVDSHEVAVTSGY